MFARWIAALLLGLLPVSLLANPLVVDSSTSGRITAIDKGYFYGLGGAVQIGAPITVEFHVEQNTWSPTIGPGTFTTAPQFFYHAFGVTIGSSRFDFRPPSYHDPQLANQIGLQDNVLNAAGNLVDVFELTARGRDFPNELYTMKARLEFASGTFSDPDAWSILAVEDAPLLGGTIYLNRFSEGWDATFTNDTLYADVNRFDVHFSGPAAEVPAVPEPGQYALLLAGLVAIAAVRRRQRGI